MPAKYIGRFAPSPTGLLHFGSLLGALASFLDARAQGGRWLVRIEDIDPPREMPGASSAILRSLGAHGLHWDGEVLYQSRRTEFYRDAIERLLRQGKAFFCTCSRTELAGSGGIYPGRCRHRHEPPDAPSAIRLQIDDTDIVLLDAIQGEIRQNLAREVGDFVIFRKEKLPAYQLAVVVDDAAQGVTNVVRGSDLLDSTARQVFLQRQLGLPTPQYAHIPVIANRAGHKLSKQTYALALDEHDAIANLLAALDFLGQTAPPVAQRQTPEAVLHWAARHWRLDQIPRALNLSGDELPLSCRRFST